MSQSIHGHQVMEMMSTSGKNYSKVELKSEIARTFGEDARFHTCMDSDLTAGELISFFVSKGKFVESDLGVSMPQG